MSDVMLLGVLRMPLPDDPADLDALTWLQFRDRARQAADRIESDAAEIERLREDARLLDSGRILLAGIDEFGERSETLYTKHDLRSAIKEAAWETLRERTDEDSSAVATARKQGAE